MWNCCKRGHLRISSNVIGALQCCQLLFSTATCRAGRQRLRLGYRRMCKYLRKFTWAPWDVILGKNAGARYGVVVLNRPINFAHGCDVILNLWNSASIRVTVDGGTNAWLEWSSGADVARPDLITGDMDSIDPATLQSFRTSDETTVVVTKDQNETDFTKALREIERRDSELECVVVLTEFSGRFDQAMSNVNTLYMARRILDGCRVYLLTADSLVWLLEEGAHTIDVPASVRCRREWCGLLPIGAPAQVTTDGLKWNLDKSNLEFGGMVSSSNTYEGDRPVTVETDTPIVWSMGIEGLFDTT